MDQADNYMDIEPGQPWTVDSFRPEDAEGVCQLFLSVYGRDYPIKTFIEPERLRAENAARRTISSVARTPKGEVVGHNALYNSAASPMTFESGSGAVHHLYRGGHGIFTQMVAHGQVVAREELGAGLIFGESVCNHIFSQRLCRGQGWISMAVEVDLMPSAAYAKEKSAPGRVSALVDAGTLSPRPHRVFLPPVYAQTLEWIYSGWDDHREMEPSTLAPPPGEPTEIRTQVFSFAQVARLTVLRAGLDFGIALDREEARVREQGVTIIQVWFKLTWPWVGQVAEAVRARGYFLGGVLPRWFDDDGLLMQKKIGRPDWEDMKIYFDRGKELVRLVRADWEEVNGSLPLNHSTGI